MSAIKNCILCFDEFEDENIYTPKLSELCCKYLHSSLTQRSLLYQYDDDSSSFCTKCIDSVVELGDLNDKLELYQKRISELVFILSLEILHRRGKFSNSGSNDQNRQKYRNSKRKLIAFDVSALPNCDFRKINSDVSETATTSPEDDFNNHGDICDEDFSAVNIKVERDDFGCVDECHENNSTGYSNTNLFFETTKQYSHFSTDDIGNKRQNPTLKLQKLNFCESDQKVILVENEQNNFGEEKGEMKLQSVWTKSNFSGRYKRTAVNKIHISDNCSSILGDQDGQLKSMVDETFRDGEAFQTEQELSVHEVVHSEEQPNNCDNGSTTFNSKRYLLKHKTYKCHVCKEIFTLKDRFLSHKIKIHHQGEWPFKCDVCRKGFCHKSEMMRHRIMHTDERPFVCEVCGKGFKKKSHLVTHRRFHTGEKPYKCEVCGKRYTQIGTLIVHKKNHTGERPHKCQVCGKGFIKKSLVKQHERIHTSEKHFKCEVCGKRFVQQSGLATHSKIHTGEKPFQCEVCGKGFVQKINMLTHKCRKGMLHNKSNPVAK